MQRLGLIGGTGLDCWGEAVGIHALTSTCGKPSADVAEFCAGELQVFFLPRHGERHHIPPHAINYRANIDAFKQLGVTGIIAVNAVGGIAGNCAPGTLAVADQLIDYTWGREHSFSLTPDDILQHIEFASPFSSQLRAALLRAATTARVAINDGGCLGVTQGPRLETAAEIRRCRQDGCDMVGMTTMPEAALAREAGLDYASLCINANWAAGLEAEAVTMEAIEATLKEAMTRVRRVLAALFGELYHDH